MALFIKHNSEAYSTQDCCETMTVKELIEALQGYDDNEKIYTVNINGGNVRYSSVNNSDLVQK